MSKINNDKNLDIKILEHILRYDENSGKVYWNYREIKDLSPADKHRMKIWNSRYADKEAGNISRQSNGYSAQYVHINGTKYLLARVVWALKTKEWPSLNIDHIDHNTENNKWENLRLVDYSQNNKNASKRKDNTSGFTGVQWHSKNKKWIATIGVNRDKIYLGSFSNKDEALKVRKEAEIQYGFHINHGGS